MARGGNLLQEIEDRGTIRAATDPAYPPQSFLNDQGEYEGFDIDVTKEIAKRMGVEVQWMTPSWDVLTAGSWDGRWDISVGSMTITPDRSEVLYFSPPYYYTPAAVAVHESNTDITNLETDLDGKRIGVCSACTYEQYLDGTLNVPGDYEFVVDDPQIQTYDTDSSAIQDLALGDGVRLDAASSSLTTLQEAVELRHPDKDRRRPALLRAARRRHRQGGPRQPAAAGRRGEQDRRGDARGRDAHQALEEVVRRHGPDGEAGRLIS